MRQIFFVNMYCNHIQAGIQSGHAVNEMWLKYGFNPEKLETIFEFARDHKTFILLNGGDHEALTDLMKFCDQRTNPYPWSVFREPGLNNAITSVSIIIPEKLYGTMDYWQYSYTPWEIEFAIRKEKCSLAS